MLAKGLKGLESDAHDVAVQWDAQDVSPRDPKVTKGGHARDVCLRLPWLHRES